MAKLMPSLKIEVQDLFEATALAHELTKLDVAVKVTAKAVTVRCTRQKAKMIGTIARAILTDRAGPRGETNVVEIGTGKRRRDKAINTA